MQKCPSPQQVLHHAQGTTRVGKVLGANTASPSRNVFTCPTVARCVKTSDALAKQCSCADSTYQRRCSVGSIEPVFKHDVASASV